MPAHRERADREPADAARGDALRQHLDRMLQQLADETGAAIVSSDLHDLPGVLPLSIEDLADVLLRASWEGGLTPAQCRLVTSLDDGESLSISPPRGWEHQVFDRATLYLFTNDYVHTVVSDWEEYQCPLGRLRRPEGSALVIYRCARPPEAIARGWEYSRDVVVSVNVEPRVASH